MSEQIKLEDVEIGTSKNEGERFSELYRKYTEPKIQSAIEEIKKEIYKTPAGELPPETESPSGTLNEGRNFLKSIVNRDPSIMPGRFSKNFLNEGTGSAGGYLVPPEYYNKIMTNVFTESIVRKYSYFVNSESKELYIPKLANLPVFEFVNEGGKKKVSNPSFSQIPLSRKDGGFIVLMSRQLLDDAKFDIMNFTTDIASKVISNSIDTAGFKGLGSIKGLLDLLVPCTEIETGDSILDLNFDNLIDMISAVPSASLPNARWFMHRSVWGLIKKLKYSGSNEYVVSPDDKQTMTLEGFPVVLSDNIYGVSDDEADKRFIVFGDLNYMILMMRESISISTSDAASVEFGGQQINLWQQGLIGLNLGVSFDINFSFPEAISVLRTVSA